jgi:Iron-containing redox enzyme
VESRVKTELAMARQLITARDGAVLRAKIALVRPALDIASSQIWLGPEPITAYARYLAAMYPVTVAAVPLMKFARQRCLRHPADPLSRPLAAFWTRHIRQERGHDRWVLADLAALGADPQEAGRALPSAAVAGLLGAQYQLIASVHPVTLLGCLAVMESAPPSPGLIEHVRALAGDGPTATLARHAASDARHGGEIFALLDRLRLDARLRAAVGFSALFTVRQAVALFDELADGTARSRGEGRAIPDGSAGFPGGALSAAELGLLADIENVRGGLPDVVAHSGDIAGGLFL